MSSTVISIENLSKQYRLGLIGGATFREEVGRWWARKLGRPDPYTKIGQVEHGNRDGEYIWALRDVNFEVKEGEILGIIGRNGAGKSTILKILSRIIAPTSGRIRIRGKVASLLEVGTGFHPELTGRENIFLNGTILGMTKAEISRKLDEIISFSEIEEFINTPVKRYSSGMTVRLAFSVAAHLDPEILVVDEVLAVGDAAFQKKCLGKLESISLSGRTILFVSHNMGSIRNLCSRAVLLDHGTLKDDGEPGEIIDSYLAADRFSTIARQRSGAVDKAMITDLYLTSVETGLRVESVIAGMDVCFSIHYALPPHTTATCSIEIGLAIYTAENQFITVLNNGMANKPIAAIPGEHVAHCTLRRLPLMCGPFYVRALIKVDDVVEDMIENALSFSVLEGDYYGSGRPNAMGRQGVYIAQGWDVGTEAIPAS